MRTVLGIFILLMNLGLQAQGTCVEDEDGNCIAKGKMKSIKVKTSYGGSYTVKIREGLWTMFDVEGQKVAEGLYVVKNDASYKDGEWKFYNADNVLFCTRMFMMGTIVSTNFIDTGTYMHGSDTMRVESDTLGNLIVVEKRGQTLMRYTSALKNEVKGDPYLIHKTQARESFEKFTAFDTDSMFLERFPKTNATLNIGAWSVISPLNLVNNGNFEAGYDKAPNMNNSQIAMMNDQFAISWGSSNETPDFYKTKANCYAGFRVMGVNFEVLRNHLKKPLEEGKTYCLQFKLKLKEDNSFGFNGISAVVSKDLKFFKNSEEGRKSGLILQSHPEIVLGCRSQWMTISGTFEAEGGEQYLYISNFTDNRSLKVFKADSFAGDYVNEIYYLIDDVALLEVTDDYKCPCNVSGCELNFESNEDSVKIEESIYSNPKVGQKIILRNIQFETASWTLLPESYDQLDSLLDFLLKYPSMVVEISGHTDNKGKPKDNITLSKNRAEAVIKYLIESGVDPEQLKAVGYGQEFPIDTNDNESGRFNNRRVEFKILEM